MTPHFKLRYTGPSIEGLSGVTSSRDRSPVYGICSIPDFACYLWVTGACIEAGSCCTPQSQEELSQLSFQTLHSVSKIFRKPGAFWWFSEKIIKMLDKQVSLD